MSVQVVSAAAAAKVPEVELKDLSPSEAEPQLGLSTAAGSAMAPPAGAAPGPRSGIGARSGSQPGRWESASGVGHEAERPSSPASEAPRRRRSPGQPRRHRHRGAAHSQEGTGAGLPLSEREGGGEPQILSARRHHSPHAPTRAPVLGGEDSRWYGRNSLGITWR
ncbi:hypothetical protein K5549_004801 [Capra hircus]|uniref:Uncharacterized protein n=1 Tax=Capra hircus TaxID=9925 RepID=A0A452FTM5_CAPHI|nr:hypothetical protein K5549_004801 [Capra hircus]